MAQLEDDPSLHAEHEFDELDREEDTEEPPAAPGLVNALMYDTSRVGPVCPSAMF